VIKCEVKIRIPFLWGKAVFKKENWSQINLIVGPNGSGKTLLAQAVTKEFSLHGYSVSDSVKISSKNHNQPNDENTLLILKDDETIKEKIETVLSSMFGKSIKFIEDIDTSLIPIVENKAWNVEYMLEDAECHGLREIIALLIKLYSSKDDILVCDEPELHLHPQLQMFFMNEIKKEAQKNPKKIFFIISHSPFFIDLRYAEDLIGVIVCHTNKVPTHIEQLSQDDSILFKRFLPRFNTYHKQFFFSDNQIFVEGYTDQQMFTNLLPFIHDEYSSTGTGIIDVGGKDELGVFCKVCSLLGTNGRIITDLDSLFSGKLRDVFCKDERVNAWLLKVYERQLPFYERIFTQKELLHPISLDKLIFRLERYLVTIGQEITQKNDEPPKKLATYVSKLLSLLEKHENAENVDTYKTVILQGILKQEDDLIKYLSPELSRTIPDIKNLYSLILAAAEAARVYILPKGCIEHYYTQNTIEYMPVSAKDRLFHNEIEYLLDSNKKTVQKEYSELITILEKACAL
jgi:predicted ATP-dependent endonuclease of OLD family